MINRKLTGKWYLKKFFFSYKVMVEVEGTTTCPHTFDESPVWKGYQKARTEDLIELGINCN